MFFEQQIILAFMISEVTLKTGVMILKIQLCRQSSSNQKHLFLIAL